jgi:chemotaxis protein CheC
MDIALKSMEIDALKEIANVGGGHAIESLSTVFKQKVNLGLPGISFISLKDPNILKRYQDLIMLFSKVDGTRFYCDMAMSFTKESFYKIRKEIFHEENVEFTEVDKEWIKVVGLNIINSYLLALNNFLSVDFKVKESKIFLGDSEDFVKVIMDKESVSDSALIIKVDYRVSNTNINGDFELFFMPNELELFLILLKERFGI